MNIYEVTFYVTELLGVTREYVEANSKSAIETATEKYNNRSHPFIQNLTKPEVKRVLNERKLVLDRIKGLFPEVYYRNWNLGIDKRKLLADCRRELGEIRWKLVWIR